MQGKFITLEGIEGAGKSSYLATLHKIFSEKNIPFCITKEPGGGMNGDVLRELLLNSTTKLPPITELLLMYADRTDHVENLIKPNLSKGVWVISDRYTDSSLAYQGGGRNLDLELIKTLNEKIDLPIPDLTLLFDLPVKIALERVNNRGKLDRFEKEDIEFHQRIRDCYLHIAETNKDRIKVIDSSIDQQQVQTSCSKIIHKFISEFYDK